MARSALKWSLTELAEAAGVGRATAARFEGGETVTPESIALLRKALEKKRVRFIDDGSFAGAVYRMGKAP